jgi:hypothetical protein
MAMRVIRSEFDGCAAAVGGGAVAVISGLEQGALGRGRQKQNGIKQLQAVAVQVLAEDSTFINSTLNGIVFSQPEDAYPVNVGGGGFLVVHTLAVTGIVNIFRRCNFTGAVIGNVTAAGGGVYMVYRDTVTNVWTTIGECLFAYNSLSGSYTSFGGGFNLEVPFAATNVTTEVSDSAFIRNALNAIASPDAPPSAALGAGLFIGFGGGGINPHGGGTGSYDLVTTIVTRSRFVENTIHGAANAGALTQGGGMVLGVGNADNGGAEIATRIRVTIEDCSFEANVVKATGDGDSSKQGPLYAQGGGLLLNAPLQAVGMVAEIKGCRFINNRLKGGFATGSAVDYSGYQEVENVLSVLENCTVMGNTIDADYGGGALRFDFGTNNGCSLSISGAACGMATNMRALITGCTLASNHGAPNGKD